MPEKLFTSQDVTRIFGVSRFKLAYWIDRVGAIEPTQRLPQTNLFSLRDLLDIGVVSALSELGINIPTIRKILTEPVTPDERFNMFYMGQQKEFKNIWDEVAERRATHERDGCVLLLQKAEDGYSFRLGTLRSEMSNINTFHLEGIYRPFGNLLLVDVLEIVHRVESATGEKLQ